MIKFFKELFGSIKEGIAEGVAEANQEMAQEKEQENKLKETENIENKKAIDELSFDERFGTALGAPFRVVIFGDWFTIFGSNDDDGTQPIHLYKFGNYPKLEKHKAELAKFIKRDFNIVDKKTSLEILASYFDVAGIDKNGTILEGISSEKVDANMWNPNKEGVKATISAVLSHIISASTDVGYVEKSEALEILKKVNQYVQKHYTNWENYSKDFITGEANVGLNNSAGRGILKKYIGYLETKTGSPWNTISWESSGNNTTNETTANEVSTEVLGNTVWAFQRKKYSDANDFNIEIEKYQQLILKEKAVWQPEEIAINKPEIKICYEAWIKGKEEIATNETLLDEEEDAFDEDNSDEGMFQVELCATLKAQNGKYFTNLDLMYQLEQQVSNKELGDHIFFEGLTVHSNADHESEIPTFYMYCGS